MDARWRTHELDVKTDFPVRDWAGKPWLLTNGTGAYAMGTAAGCNTGRQHGLLVVSTSPPVRHVVALNQVLEELWFSEGDGQTLTWTTWAGEPEETPQQGLSMLKRFEKGLIARWHYTSSSSTSPGTGVRVGPIEFVRQLDLHPTQQAATLTYQVKCPSGGGPFPPGTVLRLSPMLVLREAGSLRQAGDGDSWSSVHRDQDGVRVSAGDVTVTLDCRDARFDAVGPDQDPWRRGVLYSLDGEHGCDNHEDCFVPGWFEVDLALASEAVVTLTVAVGVKPVHGQVPVGHGRVDQLKPMFEHLGGRDGCHDVETQFKRTLVVAADDFVVNRRFGDTTIKMVMAGYPGLADSGRDTLVALPGLMLATGRFEDAKAMLHVFSESIQDGLVPDCFNDDGTVVCGRSVDAGLWFIHAVLEYVHASGDRDAWDRSLADATVKVLETFLRGTAHDVRMAGDGLIVAGLPAADRTWMNATRGGVACTPRHGKAVEINALWHHGLVGVAGLLGTAEKTTAVHYEKLAKRVKRSFVKVFWDEQLGYLRDRVWEDQDGQDQADPTLRPNQILAASLLRSPLPTTKKRKVIDVVRRRLLTPFGLRTLAVDDPNYHGRCFGPGVQSSDALHQGTVWPWLIGPYAEAVLRVGRFNDAARAQAREAVTPLVEVLAGSGLGQIHEAYEGDQPHRPVGRSAHAWSLAEVLRVWCLLQDGDARTG